jgi:hypothetical protein
LGIINSTNVGVQIIHGRDAEPVPFLGRRLALDVGVGVTVPRGYEGYEEQARTVQYMGRASWG